MHLGGRGQTLRPTSLVVKADEAVGTARSDVMCGSDVAIDGKAGDRVITADSAPQSLTNFLQRCDNQALDATQDDWRGYQ